jgi:hypothetical protein
MIFRRNGESSACRQTTNQARNEQLIVSLAGVSPSASRR